MSNEHEIEIDSAVQTAKSDAATESESPNDADLVAVLQQKSELEESLKEAEQRALYIQADFQNYRRRRDDEFKDLQKYSNGEFIKALLPVLDNFERALTAAEQSRNFDALISGINGTLKQLQAALQKAGVTHIEAVGKEFDPKFHEAIGEMESDEYPANTVAEEVQRGYLLHERVLRPTLVRVTG